MAAGHGRQVLLVRHGETEWSRSGQHTGTTDIPLTADGERHARLLAGRLRGRRFSLVLTSPLGRAMETCRLAGLHEQAEVTDDLREVAYGRYEGVTTREIRETRPGWTVWRDGSPGGETVQQVGERADRVIGRLLSTEGDAVVFGHGHALRILAARWIGFEARAGAVLALSTASLCILGFEREQQVVWLWNDTTHMDG